MTEANSHSQVRKLKHYISKTSINFLYLQENALSKKYLPFFSTFHKKTLSTQFRNAAGLSCPDWKVKVFLLVLLLAENEGKQKDKANRIVKCTGYFKSLPFFSCFPFLNVSSSTSRNMFSINKT